MYEEIYLMLVNISIKYENSSITVGDILLTKSRYFIIRDIDLVYIKLTYNYSHRCCHNVLKRAYTKLWTVLQLLMRISGIPVQGLYIRNLASMF
jgi:hypothetical protein